MNVSDIIKNRPNRFISTIERRLIKMKIKKIFFALFFAFVFQSVVFAQEENTDSSKTSSASSSQELKKESTLESSKNQTTNNQEQSSKTNEQQKTTAATSSSKQNTQSKSSENSSKTEQSPPEKTEEVPEKKPTKTTSKKSKTENQEKEEEKSDSENSQNEDSKYNLPDVKEDEIEKNLSLNNDSPKKDNSKNLIWTIFSWVLISLGTIIIIIAIVNGFKSSKEGEIYLNSKYSAKKYRNKNNRYK